MDGKEAGREGGRAVRQTVELLEVVDAPPPHLVQGLGYPVGALALEPPIAGVCSQKAHAE